MTDKSTEVLNDLRNTIDRLDSILVYTLAERFAATKQVGQLKALHELPPADPKREVEQIKRLRKLALDANLDPEFAEKFLTFIIKEVVKNHRSFQSNKNAT